MLLRCVAYVCKISEVGCLCGSEMYVPGAGNLLVASSAMYDVGIDRAMEEGAERRVELRSGLNLACGNELDTERESFFFFVGFLGGMFGTAGPPQILYIAIVGGLTKSEVRATFSFISMLNLPINITSAALFGIYQGIPYVYISTYMYTQTHTCAFIYMMYKYTHIF